MGTLTYFFWCEVLVAREIDATLKPHSFKTASSVFLSRQEIKNSDNASTKFDLAFAEVSPCEWTSKIWQEAK